MRSEVTLEEILIYPFNDISWDHEMESFFSKSDKVYLSQKKIITNQYFPDLRGNFLPNFDTSAYFKKNLYFKHLLNFKSYTHEYNRYVNARSMTEKIFLKFSDDTIISLGMSVYHKNIVCVPDELKPININIEKYFEINEGVDINSIDTHFFMDSTTKYIIAKYCKTALDLGHKVSLIDQQIQPSQEMQSFQKINLNEIQIVPIPKIETSLSIHSNESGDILNSQIKLSVISEFQAEGNLFCFKEWGLSPEKNKLIYSYFFDQYSYFLKTIPHSSFPDKDMVFHGANNGYSFRYFQKINFKILDLYFQSYDYFSAVVNRLPSLLVKDILEKSKTFISIDKINIEPQIKFNDDNSFNIFIKLGIQNVDLYFTYDIYREHYYIYSLLLKGIGGWAEPDEISRSHKANIRKNELYLYRSQGIASMALMEICSYLISSTLTDGSTINSEKDLAKYIYKKALDMLSFANQKKIKSNGESKESPSYSKVNVSGKFESQFCADIMNCIKYFKKDKVIIGKSSIIKFDNQLYLPYFIKNIISYYLLNINKNLLFKMRDLQFSSYITHLFFKESISNSLDIERNEYIFIKTPDEIDAANLEFTKVKFDSKHERNKLLLEFSNGFKTIYNKNNKVSFINDEEIKFEFVMRENQKTNWFELHPQVFFEGKEIAFDKVNWDISNGILSYKDKFYKIPKKNIPSLNRLKKFWEQLNVKMNSKFNFEVSESTYYPLHKNQTLELLALDASGVKIIGDEKWDHIIKYFNNLNNSDRKSQLILNKLKYKLKGHQESGVKWLNDLYQLKLGAVLADEMGLGKTLQILAFLSHLQSTNELGKCLLVVPPTLVYNWISESSKFIENLPILVFSTIAKEKIIAELQKNSSQVILVTYGLLVEHEDLFTQFQWNVIAFDEAHHLKNISAQKTSAARKLTASFKICITGTPMENHLGDFYSLLDLVVPGCLGKRDEFMRCYAPKENPPSIDDINYLRLKTKPLVLRRTKNDVFLDLPEKTETTHYLDFDIQQKKIYRDIATSCNDEILNIVNEKGEKASQLKMFSALQKLRQVCSDPSVLKNINYSGIPPKIEVLMNAIVELIESGESVIVFTQFIHTLNSISKLLEKNNIKFESIQGSTTRPARVRALKNFTESSDNMVLLMTLKTGGVGLNLTKASYVFHIDPWWNPAVENQATARSHRMGQTKNVTVYRYVMKDSLEEKIEILKDKKSKLFDNLLDSKIMSDEELNPESNSASNIISKDEFMYLISSS